MVLCFIALPIFAILGIFSAKYRKLSKDALDCLFKTATLRKCETGLDTRIKGAITGKLLKFSPPAGRFVYAHYKLFSFVILAIFIWATVVSGFGVYNLAVYGNCNGPDDDGFCIFDPASGSSESTTCPANAAASIGEGIAPTLENDDPILGNPDAEFTFIEFGCYSCPFTKNTEDTMQEVLDYFEGSVNYQFKTFYIPNHNFSYEAALAAKCAHDFEIYPAYHELLFENQGQLSGELLLDFAENLGIDRHQFSECMVLNETITEVESDQEQGHLAGVQGTPTFFIGDEYVIGSKPFKTFKRVINRQKN